jgi:hypothetical protein
VRLIMMLGIAFLSTQGSFKATAAEGLVIGADTKLKYDSNIFKVIDKTSDIIFVVSPQVSYAGAYGKHNATFGYEGDYALYRENSEVNYTNHTLSGGLSLSLTQKWRTVVGLQYFDRVEQPGTNNRILIGDSEYTQFERKQFNLTNTYGNANSMGRIVVKYNNNSINYTNNNQEFRDRTINDLISSFYYRFGANTQLVLEVRLSDSNANRKDLADFSFKQRSYLGGIVWKATANTEGTFLVGHQSSDFKNPKIESLSGLSYFADVEWSPNENSSVKFGLSRTVRESSARELTGLDTSAYSFVWYNKLKNRFSLNANITHRLDRFGSGAIRKDTTNIVSFAITYDAFEWLDIFSEIGFANRNSDLREFTYDSRNITIGFIVR